MGKATSQAQYEALANSWAQRAPVARRISARIGLQGKLISCFFLLILTCSVLNCFLFAKQSGKQLSDIMGEQARQLVDFLVDCHGVAPSRAAFAEMRSSIPMMM